MLTTSAFGEAAPPGPLPPEEVLRAWEPLSLYRWLFNREARRGSAPSYQRTDAGALAPLMHRLRRLAFVPDGQVTWMPGAFLCGLRFLRDRSPDILYSSYPPASAHLLALLLRRFVDVPWVADFRDAWTVDPLDPILETMPRRRRLEGRLEEAVVMAADAVVTASELAAEDLASRYPAAAGHIEVITNGFDPEDLPHSPAPQPPVDPLRIVHTGSFSVSHPGRSAEVLFAALRQLHEQDPAWSQRLRVVLVGHLTALEQRQAAPLVNVGVVELMGTRPRAEVLELQAGAHVLLLVDHVRPYPSTNVPGKLYEYLAMRRPVLALCGPGMVERLMRETGAGPAVPGDRPDAVRDALTGLYQRHRNGQLGGSLHAADLRRYERRALTRQLASLFDRLSVRPAEARS